jgi:hypothetical protein
MDEDDVKEDYSSDNDGENEVERHHTSNRSSGGKGTGEKGGDDEVVQNRKNGEEVENDDEGPVGHLTTNEDVASEASTEEEEEESGTSEPGSDTSVEVKIERKSLGEMEVEHEHEEVGTKHVKITKKPGGVVVKSKGDEMEPGSVERGDGERDEEEASEELEDKGGKKTERPRVIKFDSTDTVFDDIHVSSDEMEERREREEMGIGRKVETRWKSTEGDGNRRKEMVIDVRRWRIDVRRWRIEETPQRTPLQDGEGDGNRRKEMVIDGRRWRAERRGKVRGNLGGFWDFCVEMDDQRYTHVYPKTR